MLVLARRVGERVFIDGGIVIEVVGLKKGRAYLGVVAPKEIAVHREEVWNAIHGKEDKDRVQPNGVPSAPAGGGSV